MDFLSCGQSEFGSVWRYEFVGGLIIAQAAPSPEHGAIISGLTAALAIAWRTPIDVVRKLVAVPLRGSTARIPDVTVGCGKLPRVMFQIVSRSELLAWRARP